MSRVPVVISDKEQYECIRRMLEECVQGCKTVQIDKASQAMDYLGIEMPELVVINFADEKIDTDLLMNVIKSDAWLLSSGIIGLCDSVRDLRESDKLRSTNVIALLELARLERQLPKVINIICHNRHMLFQRIIGSDLGNVITSSFELSNDLIEVTCFTNLICNYLYNLNRLDVLNKEKLSFVLVEMLVNAIEHGNCNISFSEKSIWLQNGGDMTEFIDERCKDPTIANRKVYLEYSIYPNHTTFRITDDGDGFDWRSLKDPNKGGIALSLHGRGVALSRDMTSDLAYNDKGNSVQFSFYHQEGVSNIAPALFKDLTTVRSSAGDTVFSEGEPSDFLYYISSGQYEVSVNGEAVTVLTHDDIFLGEMSFLLNNRRSATVKALTAGCLIRISKKEFVAGIKEKPHYSLFLARLLAQRIERLNRKLGHHHT
ncbi:MAG: cyclic nucleotide-binding domain-containing protein [Candidatus Riflebacteria bacterium]|nr:cyclic nucleotide-binding domain-containing protein [Candidatus Riflebacteria bacterium]